MVRSGIRYGARGDTRGFARNLRKLRSMSDGLDLAGRIALVTGASGSIGSPICRQLACDVAGIALTYGSNTELVERDGCICGNKVGTGWVDASLPSSSTFATVRFRRVPLPTGSDHVCVRWYPRYGLSYRDVGSLWVPSRSSTSGDLGKFVYQPAEPVMTSDV
jgi:hypothetical protein